MTEYYEMLTCWLRHTKEMHVSDGLGFKNSPPPPHHRVAAVWHFRLGLLSVFQFLLRTLKELLKRLKWYMCSCLSVWIRGWGETCRFPETPAVSPWRIPWWSRLFGLSGSIFLRPLASLYPAAPLPVNWVVKQTWWTKWQRNVKNISEV